MQLPLYHFLHYNVETEESSVHVLKLGRAITEKENKNLKAEEDMIKKGKVVKAEKIAKAEDKEEK